MCIKNVRYTSEFSLLQIALKMVFEILIKKMGTQENYRKRRKETKFNLKSRVKFKWKFDQDSLLRLTEYWSADDVRFKPKG